MFVDASALVAVVTLEPDEADLRRALAYGDRRFTSAIALYEAVHAVARKLGTSLADANTIVQRFVAASHIIVVGIEDEDGGGAIDASQKFGRGSGHPARLNMGDCFAYAMAVNRGLPLLFKGDDFGRTDIVSALA